jgi:hypothetical protein
VRAVTSNVTKSPDSLFPDIGLGASKELNEDGNSASLNNDLGLCGGAGSNVGQSPSSLELNQGVRGSQELDETANNTGLDDLLNRGVTLLGKKLSELGGGLNLRIDLVREDALHHLGKVLIQLKTGVSQRRSKGNIEPSLCHPQKPRASRSWNCKSITAPVASLCSSSDQNVGLYEVCIFPHITGRTGETGRSEGDRVCANNKQNRRVGQWQRVEEKRYTYLRLGRSGVIIAIGGGTKRSTRTVLTGSDTSSLGQVLLTLGLSDLDLLLLTATAELLRLEGVLRLELSAAMLGDVSLSHDDCYCFGPRGRW